MYGTVPFGRLDFFRERLARECLHHRIRKCGIKMNDTELVKEFLVESYENLDRLDRELVILEKAPDDPDDIGGERFPNHSHTIKGTCGFLGFGQLDKSSARRRELAQPVAREQVAPERGYHYGASRHGRRDPRNSGEH